MSTQISSLTPYCTVSDFLNRFDTNDVGLWVSEIQGQKVGAKDLLTNPKLLAALNGASGELESACVVGERYQITDLQGLVGNSLDLARDIVSWLTFKRLVDIHPYRDAREHRMVFWAEKMLEDLRNGKRIFSILENAQAENIPDPQFLTSQDLVNRNQVSVQARAFFGDRAQWNVPGSDGSN